MTSTALTTAGCHCVLHLSEASPQGAEALFPLPPGGGMWTAVRRCPIDRFRQDYDVVVPAPAVLEGRLAVSPRLKLAVWCDTVEQVMQARPSVPSTATLVFSPGNLAMLEARRLTRSVLVLARPIRKGETLTEAHLCERPAGTGLTDGVGAHLAGAMIDSVALYDMPAGAPVDFGHLQKEPRP